MRSRRFRSPSVMWSMPDRNMSSTKERQSIILQLDDVLFFQTEDDVIHVHTKDDMYETKYKLYQLEEMLPGFFMRISKSAILNTNHIYSISRNLTASSTVTFAGTHKQVFVSRYYYKPLISKLEEKRLHQ